jgi:hypothetical protein
VNQGFTVLRRTAEAEGIAHARPEGCQARLAVKLVDARLAPCRGVKGGPQCPLDISLYLTPYLTSAAAFRGFPCELGS